MGLSEKAMRALKDNLRLRNMITVQEECHYTTVERWMRENNDNLTKASILNLIHNETGIPISELLSEKAEA